MAKRIIDWTLDRSSLIIGEYVDSETTATELERFDVEKLFPMFQKFNPVQRFLTIYGLKQKLADCGSSVKTAVEKAESAKNKFEELVKVGDGEMVSSRSNGTGVKVKVRKMNELTEKTKVISYEGLMLKKLAFADTFTEEDEKKLQEFEKIKLEHLAKQVAQAEKTKPKAVKPKK